MLFSHAIVIDFEATCYDKLEKPPPGWRAEIVEFPAVLIDLDSGEILDEFHFLGSEFTNLKKKSTFVSRKISISIFEPCKVVC